MLWSYHVASLIDEGNQVRINTLVMPHARITGKGTGIVAPGTASQLLDDIVGSPLVLPGIPASAAAADDGEAEFSYSLLVAKFDGPRAEFFHATLNEASPGHDDNELLDRINRLLGKTNKTYRHGDRVPARQGP
jgi:hypothetical protein